MNRVNLEDIAREALEAQSAGYINLIEGSTKLLASEKGVLENFSVEGRLIKAKPSGETIIVGDLHGDFESLIHILKASRFAEKAAQNKELLLVFLGEYGDRGPYSPEVYYIVLKLKQLFPQNVRARLCGETTKAQMTCWLVPMICPRTCEKSSLKRVRTFTQNFVNCTSISTLQQSWRNSTS